ncbi:MAG: GNAT family N-acetyltransferase [Ktedonobacteraceae bacterium]|nr:GNAT family N-acetyltransferase [Ktedonobacteraceae bacterium]
MVIIERYIAQKHRKPVRLLLEQIGWAIQYVNAGVLTLDTLDAQPLNARIYIATQEDHLVGWIAVEFREWNRLAQVQGLAVDPTLHRQGIATQLIEQAEQFMQERGARGIYVDTPVSNQRGRKFYEAVGYKQDYVMTEYYEEGLDGVTYIKFF